MICVVILGPSIQEARKQIKEAESVADLVELRLDHFVDTKPERIASLTKEFKIPMLFTLRSREQGGWYKGDEESRKNEIMDLASCQPAYFDLDYTLPPEFIKEFQVKNPVSQIVLSYHDFSHSCTNLKLALNKMPKIDKAIYKIATLSSSICDSLKMLISAKETPAEDHKIVIGMGDVGQITRILAPWVGSLYTYATLKPQLSSAPGQLSVKELTDTYRYASINSSTQLFGLAGNPVTESIGHHCHNTVFENFNLNAVYVKMKVNSAELPLFFKLAQKAGFKGLSITMPHKEAIILLLDEVHEEARNIGAVNTVVFDAEGRSIGYNTDGAGALDSIEESLPVKGKKLVIVGAGGACKAIAYEAVKRGAHVILLNRTADKALAIAERFGCQGAGMDKLPELTKEGYDVLINSTPDPMPVDPQYLLPQALVMDITTNPIKTLFLSNALKAGCKIVPGYKMFIKQAEGQLDLWFDKKLDHAKVNEILKKTAQESL